MMHSALLVLAAAEGEGGLSGPFAVEPGLMIWTWLVFIVLFLALRKWAWPPIVRLTEEREQKIAAQLADAERLNAEAAAALEEHRKLLASAKEEAHALLNEAKGFAEQERQHLLVKAQEEHDRLLERARREIDTERERAVGELRREAVELSLAAAAKLIERRLDTDTDRRLVEDYLTSLGNDLK
jgi:F-type H+-transporting ATPase subunit b